MGPFPPCTKREDFVLWHDHPSENELECVSWRWPVKYVPLWQKLSFND